MATNRGRGLKDSQPGYWDDYSNLQRVKHDLVRSYLNGWFPKLGYWSGRIVYLDTHAGKGRHKGGQHGSPMVALNTFLAHRACQDILRRCEVVFSFIEADANNCESLKGEIARLGSLPPKVCYEVEEGDCYKSLRESLDYLEEEGQKMAPAFIFIDPYGFKVPGSLLAELMTYDRVELFINVIWRELNMGIHQGPTSPGMAETLDLIFNSADWRTRITSDDFDERADQAADLFQDMVGAKWGTHIKMLGKNNATRYFLLHLTNHDAGRELMKDCMWSVCPEGV